MIVLILGPPGSGKSTQGKLLAEKLKIRSISMGQILRDLYAQKDRLGIEAAQYWQQGRLLPDGLIRQIIERFLRQHQDEFRQGFVMDGFPRDLAQYKWVRVVFPFPIAAVILIQLDQETILQRLALRQRPDDTRQAIARRFIEQDVTKVIERFRQDRTPVVEVDGRLPVEQVHEQIWQGLSSIIQV